MGFCCWCNELTKVTHHTLPIFNSRSPDPQPLHVLLPTIFFCTPARFFSYVLCLHTFFPHAFCLHVFMDVFSPHVFSACFPPTLFPHVFCLHALTIIPPARSFHTFVAHTFFARTLFAALPLCFFGACLTDAWGHFGMQSFGRPRRPL